MKKSVVVLLAVVLGLALIAGLRLAVPSMLMIHDAAVSGPVDHVTSPGAGGASATSSMALDSTNSDAIDALLYATASNHQGSDLSEDADGINLGLKPGASRPPYDMKRTAQGRLQHRSALGQTIADRVLAIRRAPVLLNSFLSASVSGVADTLWVDQWVNPRLPMRPVPMRRMLMISAHSSTSQAICLIPNSPAGRVWPWLNSRLQPLRLPFLLRSPRPVCFSFLHWVFSGMTQARRLRAASKTGRSK